MNPQSHQDIQKRLQQMEAEMGQPTPPKADSSSSPSNPSVLSMVNSLRQWFLGLPQAGKVVVGIGGTIALLTALSLVLQLISLSIKLAVFGLLLFGGYRLLTHLQTPRD